MSACRVLRLTMMSAAFAVLLMSTSETRAGIVAPPQIGFDDKDLERSFSSNESSSGTSASRHSEPLPARNDQDQQPGPLGLNASIPMGQSSSSSSSSSTGGSAGTSAAVCLLSGAIVIDDDAFTSRLAEDSGLSLPDAPGTDLLRPPQS